MKLSYNVKNYSVIILAAGRSSRLGQAKQLLAYKGKMLLQHAIDSARQVHPQQLIVVLGANKELILNHIELQEGSVVENPKWESGIASSIKTGLKALNSTYPAADGVILMVCDQPFADSTILQKLIDAQKTTGKTIIGCSYDGAYGTPALFHSSLFPDLLELTGDSGAKKLFEKYQSQSFFVSFDKGGIDIDTSEDYQKLPK
ncbi:MAG: nucleotidyltransferase family protein [Daejeonella sp.]|uniref:nucleotidyltransferase family protein n=1 Tax=Daejeonella sp. JGW-45 TaxID=3034148 RepID=UPI0023EC0B61|nr:nucleotidyltransferase family protein [Daejeonella sp. JGW-45]